MYFLVLAATMGGAGDVSAEMQSQLERLKQEPTVQEVQDAALRFYRISPEKVSAMRSGAAWKAILPVITVDYGAGKSETRDDSRRPIEYPVTDELWADRDVSGNESGWSVTGTWALPLLIFNSEELDVTSLASLMEGVLKESTRIYFLRRRLQVDKILTPPGDLATRLAKELREEELTGLIDAMTGSWFSKELGKRFGDGAQASAETTKVNTRSNKRRRNRARVQPATLLE